MPKAITGHKKSFSVYNWISKEFNIHSLELGKSKNQLNCIVTSQDPSRGLFSPANTYMEELVFLTTILNTLLFHVKQTKIIVSQQLNKTVLLMNFQYSITTFMSALNKFSLFSDTFHSNFERISVAWLRFGGKTVFTRFITTWAWSCTMHIVSVVKRHLHHVISSEQSNFSSCK